MSASVGLGKMLVAAGHKTNVLESGNASKVVFLLHGSGPGVSAWTNWSTVIPELDQHFHIVAPDIAGFGYTEFKEGSKYDIKLWVNHLVGIMDEMSIQKASFVGNSFGGALAIGLALFAPERVEKLILLGTPAGEFEQTAGLRSVWEYEPSLESMRAIMELFPFDSTFITDEMVRVRYEASVRPGAQTALRQLIPKPKEGGTIVKGFPEASLRNIVAPTLVLHGREDSVVPPECGFLLARCIPRSELHLFGQCGHWVQIEHKRRFVQLVRDFCNE
ncbi:alpha/beta fold hydrolase [Pusillimonas sp. DMV24BSW_D]|uniref:alpha/beta fold hydrolase n=1 Tax=Neopusillimonas aestuarii TaxID=2716226 RepID=UPI00140BA1F9|nr:alpha/beta hydrolase [Pusillimonas sp. DMV24BSW_D]QIM47914.1 alpha/beta fold hydrolase [Pusillimonas sp. DMV24BSW_D]